MILVTILLKTQVVIEDKRRHRQDRSARGAACEDVDEHKRAGARDSGLGIRD